MNALKKYLKLFEDKSLCRICGKNVTVAEKEIVAACLQLNEVGVLTYETLIDVPTGLTNYSVPDCVKLFDFLLHQAKVKALDADTHEGNIFKQINAILSKLLMLTIDFAQQVSGMLATNQVDISVFAGNVRREDVS